MQEHYIPKLQEKLMRHISNCITCIITNRKQGMQEGELHPVSKEAESLRTYPVDHLGPLEMTSKQYKHIFAVIDAFTKFCWLYPTKSTTSKEAIAKLHLQSLVFANPFEIVSDRDTAFTSDEFRQYCEAEGVFEAPSHTTTCTEYMQPWSNYTDETYSDDEAFGSNA